MKLSEYEYDIAYKPGKTNHVANALSRNSSDAQVYTLTNNNESSNESLFSYNTATQNTRPSIPSRTNTPLALLPLNPNIILTDENALLIPPVGATNTRLPIFSYDNEDGSEPPDRDLI